MTNMQLTKVQKEIGERLAELLAQSVLDDKIKQVILDGLDKLPEYMVFKLLDALELENDQVEQIAADIEAYLLDQEAGWQEVEEDQQKFADKYIEDMAQKLDEEARILELKESFE